MAVNIAPNPYDIIIDTEMTDTTLGVAMQVAAIRVVPGTDIIVGRYESKVRIALNSIISKPGQLAKDKIEDEIRYAPSEEDVAREFLEWIEGPTWKFGPPRIIGYCIHRDLPVLIRQFGWGQRWIAKADTYDVAVDGVFQEWTEEQGRSLDWAAEKLNVPYDKTKRHDALYDCELTLAVKLAFDKARSNGTLPSQIPAPAATPSAPQTIPIKTDLVAALEGGSGLPSYEWALARSKDPKYQRVKCPHCGHVCNLTHNGQPNVASTCDEWFYMCSNPACLNKNGKSRFAFNIDGTKGPNRFKIIDIDANLLP